MTFGALQAVKPPGVLVICVRGQAEGTAAGTTLEAAAMEEQALCTETLHHINPLLTEETDVTAAGRDLRGHTQQQVEERLKERT